MKEYDIRLRMIYCESKEKKHQKRGKNSTQDGMILGGMKEAGVLRGYQKVGKKKLDRKKE